MNPNGEKHSPKCPECGGLRGGHANYRCSLMTLEYAQQKIIDVEQRWIRLTAGHHSNFQRVYDRLKKQITAQQGKIALLKRENNKLRKAAHVSPHSEKQPPL